MPYTFNKILLSAAKMGSPALQNSSLSADGVKINSLSANDAGITFNPLTTLSNTLCAFTVEGSEFSIDIAYNGQTMAIVKTLSANVQSYNVFPYLSSLSALAVSSLSSQTDVSTPEVRRKWVYGYM